MFLLVKVMGGKENLLLYFSAHVACGKIVDFFISIFICVTNFCCE